MSTDKNRFLKDHPVCQGLGADALAILARDAEVADFGPGELLLRSGEAAGVFGFLMDGRAEAVVGSGTPSRRRLGVIEAGECFGEMSLLTGESTNADVVTLCSLHALFIPIEGFQQIVATNPKSVQYLARLIKKRSESAEARQEAQRGARPIYSLGANVPMRILVVNCGSSSLKYTYYDTSSEMPMVRGLVERIGTSEARHVCNAPQGRTEEKLPGADHEAAFKAAAAALCAKKTGVLGSMQELSAIGHRVVHGGSELNAPALCDEKTKGIIKRMCALAPLHNPLNLLGIELCEKLCPGVPQVAVFDTAFHARMPATAYLYAIPRELADKDGLRRYGFHGTSHEFVARCAAKHLGRRFGELNMITCHLGNGVSMAAVEHGRSVDTSMGLTPLEGLVMGTRCGDVDPGLILHLMREKKMDAAAIDTMLNRKSGLLGLSGGTSDMRELQEAAEKGDRNALTAIQSFCYRAKKYVGAYMAVLGRADALLFTGGIGEGSAGVRARICQGLARMGIVLDEEKNRKAKVKPGEVAEVSDAESPVKVLVVGTDEERMIAQQTVQTVRNIGTSQVIQKQGQQKPIPVGVSAHHVHLTQADVETLFGAGHQLTRHIDLSQPGQFACKEQVTLVGPKARIERVRVLGPARKESQVEISRTEEFKLGIDAPTRASGDIEGTPGITLEGSAGSVVLAKGVIAAMRHIHMSPSDALEYALRDKDVVRVRIDSKQRSLIFGDVMVRVHPEFRLEMHIDTDEANAAELGGKAVCHLESIQQRGG